MSMCLGVSTVFPKFFPLTRVRLPLEEHFENPESVAGCWYRSLIFVYILVYLVIYDSGELSLEHPLLSWYPEIVLVPRENGMSDPIRTSIHDEYSVGPSVRTICTRCCFTSTNMIQVCGSFGTSSARERNE